jgi:hypothetical protein
MAALTTDALRRQAVDDGHNVVGNVELDLDTQVRACVTEGGTAAHSLFALSRLEYHMVVPALHCKVS